MDRRSRSPRRLLREVEGLRHGGVGVHDAMTVEAVERGRALAEGVELGVPPHRGVILERRNGAGMLSGSRGQDVFRLPRSQPETTGVTCVLDAESAHREGGAPRRVAWP